MSGYIGVEPVTQVTKVRTFGTLAVASTTIPVAGGFSPGNIEVYINGDYVLPTDYNESDGLTIVFSITLDAGTDYVVIEARQFLVADTWSKAEADARYAEITGGADANFAAMPQVGGAPIVESGSNIDGEWTRWADGTQTIFRTYVAISVASGGSRVSAFTFPVIFVSLPVITTSGSTDFTAAIGEGTTSYNSQDLSLTGVTIGIRNRVASVMVLGYTATATGRWK